MVYNDLLNVNFIDIRITCVSKKRHTKNKQSRLLSGLLFAITINH
jgi:hypothetical protein